MRSRFSSRLAWETHTTLHLNTNQTITEHCVCVFLSASVCYPEALEVARLQQVAQVQDLSYRPFLLLRHSSQGKSR